VYECLGDSRYTLKHKKYVTCVLKRGGLILFLGAKNVRFKMIDQTSSGLANKSMRTITKPITKSVTQMLNQWAEGHHQYLNKAIGSLYPALRSRARNLMRKGRNDDILGTMDLVNDAFVRLCEMPRKAWISRFHFINLMAQLMRQTSIDDWRARKAKKRGSGLLVESIDAIEEAAGEAVLAGSLHEDAQACLALAQDLQRLAQFNPRQARVFELRYVQGLDVVLTARMLGISESTVVRDTRIVQQWVSNELRPDTST
jgi:RNA polymerase sigma-70 factor, ECF subfamily